MSAHGKRWPIRCSKASPSGLQDLKLIAQNAPQLAHALINCHQAYRRASEQLASMDDTLGRHSTAADPSPYEEVRDFFHFLDNYVDRLDRAAELLAVRLDIPANDLAHGAYPPSF